jgi:hypothetical protein
MARTKAGSLARTGSGTLIPIPVSGPYQAFAPLSTEAGNPGVFARNAGIQLKNKGVFPSESPRRKHPPSGHLFCTCEIGRAAAAVSPTRIRVNRRDPDAASRHPDARSRQADTKRFKMTPIRTKFCSSSCQMMTNCGTCHIFDTPDSSLRRAAATIHPGIAAAGNADDPFTDREPIS